MDNPFGDPRSRHYLQYCDGKEQLPLDFQLYPEYKTQNITPSELLLNPLNTNQFIVLVL